MLGGVRAVDPIPVTLPWSDAGQVRVPGKGVDLFERQPVLRALLVEEAQLDLLGDLAEQGEVRAIAVERRAKGVRAAGPALGEVVSQ